EQAELDDEIVDAALEATGTTHLMDRDITVLSGGERARVAMARASAAHPGCTFRRAHRSDGYSLSGTVFGPHQRASLARGNRDRCFARLKCRCRLLRFHRLPRPRTHSRLRRCRYCLHDGYFVRGLWLANRRLEESRGSPYCSPTRSPGRFASFPHHFHKLDR